jgi:hypothetical protein
MGNLEALFAREAEEAAAGLRKVHPAKVAADPHPGHTPVPREAIETHPLPAVPEGHPLPTLATEPVAFRPYVQMPALSRALEKAGAGLPAGLAPKLIADVETRLAGRALDQLEAAELAKVRQALETKIAASAPAAQRQQAVFRDKARALRNVHFAPEVRVSAAKAPGGTWLFWHSPSPTRPDIWGESFVPTKPHTPVPGRRPNPIDAGITGAPQWRDDLGRPIPERPPVPAKPAVAASQLGAHALDAGPEVILAEVRRAQQRADTAAVAHESPAPLHTKSVSGPAAQRTATRITSIERFAAQVPVGEWDELLVVKTTTGKETKRLPSSEMDKVLKPASSLPDPRYKDWARLHPCGPITGDETLAGLAYGPHEGLNLLQKDTAEAFMRWDAKRQGQLNVKAEMPVTIKQYIKYREIGAERYPFVRTVKYEFTLENGKVVTAVMDITPEGVVTTMIQP